MSLYSDQGCYTPIMYESVQVSMNPLLSIFSGFQILPNDIPDVRHPPRELLCTNGLTQMCADTRPASQAVLTNPFCWHIGTRVISPDPPTVLALPLLVSNRLSAS